MLQPLKPMSSYASPERTPDSASRRERKRAIVRRHVGTNRRVTFSPFAKSRGGSLTSSQLSLLPDEKPTTITLSSGFTFSSPTEAEKNKMSRRQEELQTIQIMYRAVKRKPHSVKSLLLANVPGLKRLNVLAGECLEYFKSMRAAIPWLQRSRSKSRARRIHRSPWIELENLDDKPRVLSWTPALLLPPSTSSTSKPLTAQTSLLPDLTLASRGSFANLLRREGISVDEDERHVKRAIEEDLRGVSTLSKRRHCRTMGSTVSALVFQPPPATYGYTRRYFFLRTAMNNRIPAFFIPCE
ncbi:hypothetical protein PsorP6_000318 [Peronosclerospora sorghi]|uniref:Uncharacterized protein n=1 Tax=Peronosclerospora sorghi TaxID=230839 RepID=A0ACC0WVH0_9STRA|nr:hypothetical protein PsorP6_000318 [Peronosclerospora sorghi]